MWQSSARGRDGVPRVESIRAGRRVYGGRHLLAYDDHHIKRPRWTSISWYHHKKARVDILIMFPPPWHCISIFQIAPTVPPIVCNSNIAFTLNSKCFPGIVMMMKLLLLWWGEGTNIWQNFEMFPGFLSPGQNRKFCDISHFKWMKMLSILLI